MKRTTVNAIVDTLAFFPLSVAAITGIIIWLYLLRGSPFRAFGTILSYETFLGIERQMWVDIHVYFGLAFTVLVVLHLTLHWGFIKCLPRRFIKGVRKEAEVGVLCVKAADVADTQDSKN